MEAIKEQYQNLELAIDEVRLLIERWMNEQVDLDDEAPDPQALRHAQLVLHEWLANLLQHADFDGETPNVHVHLRADDQHLHGQVIDNSNGFDLNAHLTDQHSSAEALPERGMGLRIINACAEDFSYVKSDDERYRFEFSIPADHDPWLSMLF